MRECMSVTRKQQHRAARERRAGAGGAADRSTRSWACEVTRQFELTSLFLYGRGRGLYFSFSF